MAFNFDAAAANDGLAIDGACVTPGFRLGLEIWSPTGEATEVGGFSSGVAVSCAAPVIRAGFDTTAPSAKVV